MRSHGLQARLGGGLAAVVLAAGCASGPAATPADIPAPTDVLAGTPTPSATPTSAATPPPAPTQTPTTPAAQAPTPAPTPVPSTGKWVNALLTDNGPLAISYPPDWQGVPFEDGVNLIGPNGGIRVASGPKGTATGATAMAEILAAWKDKGWVATELAGTACGESSNAVMGNAAYDGGELKFTINHVFVRGDLVHVLVWTSPPGNETADTAIFQQFLDACYFPTL